MPYPPSIKINKYTYPQLTRFMACHNTNNIKLYTSSIVLFLLYPSTNGRHLLLRIGSQHPFVFMFDVMCLQPCL